MATSPEVEFTVDATEAGLRLDRFLARKCPEYSRVRLSRAISEGGVLVDGRRTKPAFRLCADQAVAVRLPEATSDAPRPEPIDLDILYEDDTFIALNKPPGMVVHPSKGHWGGTLANALTHHFQSLSKVGGVTRPGIVHRLDRDTSGVIVVAKTDHAHLQLAEQWSSRSITKEYVAVSAGVPDRDRDVIDRSLGIHPYQREKMAIRSGHSSCRDAQTYYEVIERWGGFSMIRVFPRTGRTHQIRVHLAHIGCPVLCDRLYGGRSQITWGEVERSERSEILLNRQALHARRLTLRHPADASPLEIEAPIPPDIDRTIRALRAHRASG